MAVLVNPTRPGVDAQSTQAQQAARAVGLTLQILKASNERDLDAVFASIAELRAGATDFLFGNLNKPRIERI